GAIRVRRPVHPHNHTQPCLLCWFVFPCRCWFVFPCRYSTDPRLTPAQTSRTPATSDPARLTTACQGAPSRASVSESSAHVEYVVYAPMTPVCTPIASHDGQSFDAP